MIRLYLRSDTRLNFRERRGRFPPANGERRTVAFVVATSGQDPPKPLNRELGSGAADATFISLLSRLMNLSFPLSAPASRVARNGFLYAKFRTSAIPLPFFSRLQPPFASTLCRFSWKWNIVPSPGYYSCIWYRGTSVPGLEGSTGSIEVREGQETICKARMFHSKFVTSMVSFVVRNYFV